MKFEELLSQNMDQLLDCSFLKKGEGIDLYNVDPSFFYEFDYHLNWTSFFVSSFLDERKASFPLIEKIKKEKNIFIVAFDLFFYKGGMEIGRLIKEIVIKLEQYYPFYDKIVCLFYDKIVSPDVCFPVDIDKSSNNNIDIIFRNIDNDNDIPLQQAVDCWILIYDYYHYDIKLPNYEN